MIKLFNWNRKHSRDIYLQPTLQKNTIQNIIYLLHVSVRIRRIQLFAFNHQG